MIFLCLFISLLCSGCSIFEKQKIPLEGKRISIAEEAKKVVKASISSAFLKSEIINNTEWLQTSFSASHTMPNFALSKNLKEKWQLNVSPDNYKIIISPIATSKAIFIMTTNGTVKAVDFNGKLLWETEVVSSSLKNLGGGLASDGLVVYVTTPQSEILALNSASGKILWRESLLSSTRSGPVISRGRLFVLTVKNQVQSFDAKTGTMVWLHTGIAEETVLLGGSAPAVSDDKVIVGLSSGEVIALSFDDGEFLWSQNAYPLKKLIDCQKLSHIKASPVIYNERVYTLTYDGQLSCFDIHSGESLWTYPIGGTQTPIIIGKVLFCLSNDKELVALDACSGQEFWTRQLEKNTTWTGPIMADKLLYISNAEGKLVALDPLQCGKLLYSQDLGESSCMSHIIVNNNLIIISQYGTLFLFSGKDK